MTEVGLEARPGAPRGAPVHVPDAPYVGLAPYREEDAFLFFGREAEREIIAANLIASRFTVLYGASGVGKSSVLAAGVLPHLRAMSTGRSPQRNGHGLVPVMFSAWADDPLAGLHAAIRQAFGHVLDAADDTLAPRGTSLEVTLRSWTEQTGIRLLVILDQFEDYFLYHPTDDGRHGFGLEFADAVISPRLRVNFLVAVREDALAALDVFKGRIGRVFGNHLRLSQLAPADARRAIEGPLEQYNRLLSESGRLVEPYEIEPELTEAVLEQVQAGRVDAFPKQVPSTVRPDEAETGEIEAPYLQLVMTRVWEEELARGSGRLRLATLEKLGGATEIVRTHLDTTLQAMDEHHREMAARIFRFLVTPSGAKIALTPGDVAELSELPEDRLTPVLRSLAERRILRPVAPLPGQQAASRYEIHHDTLSGPILDWRRRFLEDRARRQERRRRRRRRSFVTAIGSVAAALLAVGLVAFVNRQQALVEAERQRAEVTEAKAAAPVGEFEDPTASEEALLADIPQRFQDPPCTRAVLPPGAIAAVDCFTDTPQLLTFARFPETDALDAAYAAEVASSGVSRFSGACGMGRTGEHDWVGGDAEPRGGRVLCYLHSVDGEPTPVFIWTDRENLVLAAAARPGGTLPQLGRFWATRLAHLWRTYEDSTVKYRIRYPDSWVVVLRSETSVDLVSRDEDTFLRIEWTSDPGPSAVQGWETLAQDFAARHPGYRELRIESTTFRGFEAAEWEFTFPQDGVLRHALDLAILTDGLGFALLFETSEDEWDESQEVFEFLQSSFRLPAEVGL
jgi:hypothetical protein